jgi:hypothetical protein
VTIKFPDYGGLQHEPWWATMSQLIEASPVPADPAETMDLCVSLAVMRSRVLDREMIPLDVVIAASVLCWNPFKPGPEGIFQDAASEARTVLTERLRNGAVLVSDDAGWMRASTDQIFAAMAQQNPSLPVQLFLG